MYEFLSYPIKTRFWASTRGARQYQALWLLLKGFFIEIFLEKKDF
jgi:hypothetical protein